MTESLQNVDVEDLTPVDGAFPTPGESADSADSGANRPAPVSRNGVTFMGIVLCAAGAIAFMSIKGGPQSAPASTALPPVNGQTITTFLISGTSNLRILQDTLKQTEAMVGQFAFSPSAGQIPLDGLKSNPFRQSLAAQAPAEAELARRRRETERGEALKAVQALQLQSVLFSDTRRACMVNNTMLREGQQIADFTVDKISASGVIVRNGTYRFELKMQP